MTKNIYHRDTERQRKHRDNGSVQLRVLCLSVLITVSVLLSGCGAGSLPIVPTARPTVTPTATPRLAAARPTPLPTTAIPSATPGGPSATPLFGPSRTPAAIERTATRAANPNAPRIEFFTADTAGITPGGTITLYWSTRSTTSAVIYRLERGVRNQLWNVGADGSLPVVTRRGDRGEVNFLLVVGDGDAEITQGLSIPLTCPDAWFFQPAPETCPSSAARETALVEQPFERGRMVYVTESNLVYALFNDGFAPAWAVFENRFDPAVDPESDPNFPNPPERYQPLRQLGFLWRGSDTVRNRLGLGVQPEESYISSAQGSTSLDGATTLYLSSVDGSVLQLLPEGEQWTIIISAGQVGQ